MNHNKKIYFITDSYPFGKGEATFVKPELEELAKVFDVTVISCCKESVNRDADFLTDNGIGVLQYDNSRIKTVQKIACLVRAGLSPALFDELKIILTQKIKIFERIRSSVWFIFESELFKKWLSDNKLVDVNSIYYTYWYFSHTLSLVSLKKEGKITRIMTRAHGYDIHGFEMKSGRESCKRYMDPWMNLIVFIADEGRKYYLNESGLSPTEKQRIFHLGAPCSNADLSDSLFDNRSDVFTLVSCSTISVWKRVNRIIDALELIDGYKINWIHFGEGDLFEETVDYAEQKLANKLNISFRFAGFVDRTEIYEYYGRNEANCYILLSSSEGLPVANMEALAHGLPIIVTNVGGCYETIKDNGVLLSSDPDPLEIKNAIEHIIASSEAEYVAMRKNSYRLWQDQFDSSKNTREFSNLLLREFGG